MSTTVNVIDLNGSDVQNARDVSIGGKALVDGNVVIGHNLKVEGWLEAPNVKSTNKGVFLTLPALQAAYPNPMDGWIAGVVVSGSNNVKLYVATGGSWTDSQTTLPFTLDVDLLQQLQDDVEDLQDDMANVSSVANDALLYPTLTFVDVVDTTTDLSPYIDGEAPVSLPYDSLWEYIYWRNNEFVCKYNGSYYSKWSNNGKSLYMIKVETEVGGVTVVSWQPRKRKLYVRRDGQLFYFDKQNTFAPLGIDASQIQAQIDSITSDIATTNGNIKNILFVNANKLLGLGTNVTTLSAVTTAINNLPNKADYQVPGVVVTFLTAQDAGGGLFYSLWESWQWSGLGYNWSNGWSKYQDVKIAPGESYLTKDSNGCLKLSADAKRAIDAVLNNAFSYEIIP